ncbi:unnamed protein product [Oncorhynchus mykiss]|uniref:Uncharacterized protein n=1 Tax=Oncorhynchus mykiss TaxID=8022 RepID=A0A060W097_ONCMY|nr:unnamed protein product [Oncorhynchus mykiss]
MELERLQIVDCIKDYKAKAHLFSRQSLRSSRTARPTPAWGCEPSVLGTRLVDNFTQKVVVLAAEGRYHVPVTALPSTHHTTDQEDSEEEDLQGVFSEVVGGGEEEAPGRGGEARQ